MRVIVGSIFDVAVDISEGSATYGKWCGATLLASSGDQIYVPAGFAHAYCTLEPDTLVASKIDGFYNKSAEGDIRWDDPDIAIDLPIPRDAIEVSDRDRELPQLPDAPTPFCFHG